MYHQYYLYSLSLTNYNALKSAKDLVSLLLMRTSHSIYLEQYTLLIIIYHDYY